MQGTSLVNVNASLFELWFSNVRCGEILISFVKKFQLSITMDLDLVPEQIFAELVNLESGEAEESMGEVTHLGQNIVQKIQDNREDVSIVLYVFLTYFCKIANEETLINIFRRNINQINE